MHHHQAQKIIEHFLGHSMSSSTSSNGGGAMRTKANPANKRPSKKNMAVRTSSVLLVAGHELDLSQIFVTVSFSVQRVGAAAAD